MATKDLILSCISKSKILTWHVKKGESIKKDNILATYVFTEKNDGSSNFITKRKLKAKFNGTVLELSAKPNDEIAKGVNIAEFEQINSGWASERVVLDIKFVFSDCKKCMSHGLEKFFGLQVVARLQEFQCEHNTIMKDMCCDCGADLRKEPGIPGDLNEPTIATVPVVHNILELKVSMQEAERLAKYDEQQLLRARKLVLVVDLDMTLIHTTVEPVPKDAKDVYSFTLPGHQYEYHTKLRPGARKFLENISKCYELHIFTMGSRMYAHTVARCLDPEGKFFAHRIRSRDEFINSFSKFHDLKALFPCGDHMVCIIDDREDVWNYAPNLVTVKPYKFFKGGDDINDPFKPQKLNSVQNNNKTDTIKIKSSEGDVIMVDDVEDRKSESENELKNGTSNKVHETDSGLASATNKVNKNDNENKTESDSSKESETKNDVDETSKGKPAPGNNYSQPEERVDLDDYLFYLDEVLEKVHFAFYSTLDAVKSKGGTALKDAEITKYCTAKTINPDVRVIVPQLRRQTLRGCNIVFTGVVPTNVPLEKSKAWKTAVSLGARVTQDIVTKKQHGDAGLYTTHVVAARHGTHKAHKAFRNPEIHLVNPTWLWCASERWEWPEESLFPVPLIDDKTSPVSSRQGTPQHNPFEQKTKKISPLAEGFEIPGGYNPDHFLNSLPSFSKQELEAMDKEVEGLMLSGNDSDSDEDDSVTSSPSDSRTSKGKKRKSTLDLTSEERQAKKLKKKLLKASKQVKETQSEESGSSSDSSDSDSDSDSSEDSSSDSDDTDDENYDERLGSLLENKLNE